MTTQPITLAKGMYTVKELADDAGLSPTTIYDCIAGRSKNFPTLRVKRSKPGRGGIIRIPAEYYAEWRMAWTDA